MATPNKPSESLDNLANLMGNLAGEMKQFNNLLNGPTGLIVQVELLKRDVDDGENALRAFTESTKRSVDILTDVIKGNGKPGLIQRIDKLEITLVEHEKFIDNIKNLMWKVAGIAIASGGIGSAAISAILQAVR